MYSDLDDFITDLDRRKLLARIAEPVSPDLEIAAVTDRACKSGGGGPALLFEKPTGFSMPVASNVFGSLERMCLALGVSTLDDLGREIDAAHDAADAEGHHGRAQAHAARQPAERSDAEDRVGRAVPGNRPAGRHPRRPADPHVLAPGRRAVHHAAARLHEGSRNRDAQHRHVPDAGVRRPDHRHALAAPQGRRAASPGRGAAGQAARGGRRAQPGTRAHVLRDGADARRPRRTAARRLPRPAAHRDGEVRHRRSRGAGERAHRARRATSSPASAAARARSATTRASTRSPTTIRCST